MTNIFYVINMNIEVDFMETITIDKTELNHLIRENLINILKNKEDLLELIEDIAFGKLMEEGDTSEYVPEEKVLNVLNKIK